MISTIIERASLSELASGHWSRRLARIATLLLVIALAHALARLTWLAVPVPDIESAPAANQPSDSVRQDTATANPLEAVARLHLFGIAQNAQARPVTAPVRAPETRLALKLKGVIASDDKSQAWAFIADPSGREERYGIDAFLPGRVQLSDILEDRVILRRNERFETLYLEKESGRPAAAAVPARQAANAPKRQPGTRAKRSP